MVWLLWQRECKQWSSRQSDWLSEWVGLHDGGVGVRMSGPLMSNITGGREEGGRGGGKEERSEYGRKLVGAILYHTWR